jgi:hypothetical protein
MNGTYGITKPANISSSDVEIYYNYRPNRNTDTGSYSNYTKIDSSLLIQSKYNDGSSEKALPGMYDIRLPLEYFGNIGIYMVYIKPKEVTGNILDVSTLQAYPNINGIVINLSSFSSLTSNVEDLIGYRIEYIDTNGERTGEYRIITSANRCEPVAQNSNNASQKGVMYRFVDSSNLVFLTVTPSTSMSFKSSSRPYIGKSGQKISIINTKFNPIALEIEITDKDFNTITTILEGDQIRNLDGGLITTFNENGEIYHQSMYANVTNKVDGIHHDVKISNDNVIDFNEQSNYEKILNRLR